MNDINDIFVLKKDFGGAKKGKQYCAYGGLICGVSFPIEGSDVKEVTIKFTDKNYFRLKRKYNKKK